MSEHFFAFRMDMNLHCAATRIQDALKLPSPELRDGLNIGGGEYYRFDFEDEPLYLVNNANEEVRLEDSPEADFYLWLHTAPSDTLQSLEDRISQLLGCSGIQFQIVNG